MKKKLADEAEMERRRQELLNEQDGYWRLRMEQAQAEQRLTRPAIEESETDKVGTAWSQQRVSPQSDASCCVWAPHQLRRPPLSDGLSLHQGV